MHPLTALDAYFLGFLSLTRVIEEPTIDRDGGDRRGCYCSSVFHSDVIEFA